MKYELVLDGSNLPIGIQKGEEGEIKIRNRVVDEGENTSKLAGQTKYTHVDYLPCLRELTRKNVGKVKVFWDGSGIKEWKEFDKDGEERDLGGVTLRVTKVGIEADDIIVEEMKGGAKDYEYDDLQIVTVEEAIERLEDASDYR